ncbi:MAG: response regulator, partial [Chloroflexota bacterium]|nr:response regulator [Chloroflexota bacterium]
LDMLTRRLQRRGFEVVSAQDGEMGVQVATTTHPDLILMDMSLPVIDGWEATRQIRTAAHTMPIIALTAHAVTGDKEKCLEAGCNDYEPKPIDFPSLMAKIDTWLKK